MLIYNVLNLLITGDVKFKCSDFYYYLTEI